jgi:Protein of unknown function
VILTRATSEWKKCARVIGEVLGAGWEDGFHPCSDLLLWSRLHTLADNDILEIRDDESGPGRGFVRLAIGAAAH